MSWKFGLCFKIEENAVETMHKSASTTVLLTQNAWICVQAMTTTFSVYYLRVQKLYSSPHILLVRFFFPSIFIHLFIVFVLQCKIHHFSLYRFIFTIILWIGVVVLFDDDADYHAIFAMYLCINVHICARR